ncbi:YaiI/YqxD family protein [Hasllibacter sp. MH4015]|uniref:YaiI/YqxD family protein n=1 Tax=Hasllibacter sp. MH4015 TaxID=2854029 RepID=UPI001CD1A672|nr:YaiI/YqxD family protein [Hasllibacter sp. MH4015]
MTERQILVDADACPVKEEIYKAAWRHEIPVRLVAGSYLRHPEHPLITMEMAGDAFDAADDVIEAAAGPGSLVITADILLAERCLGKGAAVLNHKGQPFTANSIGTQVATRAIMADIRAGLDGQGIGGQKPFSKADRSAFSNALETALRRLN